MAATGEPLTSRIAFPCPAGTLKVGVVSLVWLSVLLVPVSLAASRSGAAGVAGSVVSMVTFSAGLGALWLPAASTSA